MYGVPTGLDIRFLHGSELIRVHVGPYQIQLFFYPEAHISVECEWKLLGEDGTLHDRGEPGTDEMLAFPVRRLLGRRVGLTEVNPPTSISLQFDCGEVLRIIDSDTNYESFSIQPGNIYI